MIVRRLVLPLLSLARRPRMFWTAFAVTAGCAHPAPPVAFGPRVPVDTIWYISARAREHGRTTLRLSDSLEFGLVTTVRRGDGDPLTQPLHLALRDSVVLTRVEFVQSLRARARAVMADDPVAVLFVHGFGTGQQEAWMHAAEASARSQSRIPWVVFCWPSKGSGISWPRAGAIFARAYWDDSASAEASRPALAQSLNTVLDAVGGAHTMLVVHSLGSQLTAEALSSNDSLRARLTAEPLRSLVFFAADIDARRFAQVIVPAMQPLTSRVLLYASSNDRMLAFSKSINKGNRAGLIRGSPPQPLIGAHFETIDVTEGFAAGGRLQRTFGNHHTLSRASGALFDIMHIVSRGLSADCRSTLGTAQQHVAGDWQLTRIAPPAPAALARCVHLHGTGPRDEARVSH